MVMGTLTIVGFLILVIYKWLLMVSAKCGGGILKVKKNYL